MPKIDTVGDKYYRPVAWADTTGSILFWAISTASVATLLIDKVQYPIAFGITQVVFISGVVLYFLQGQIQRLYLFPRAEDERRRELLSISYQVSLTHEVSEGYYNNDQVNPTKRLAASVMESAFFTREIAGRMLIGHRLRTAGYLIIYVAAVLNRSTNLEFIAVAAQAVFSEEIISRWLKMEWLRNRSERVFDELNSLFGGRPAFSRPAAQAQSIDCFSSYETSKSTAAILLSSAVFRKENARLTAEWDRIRQRLGI